MRIDLSTCNASDFVHGLLVEMQDNNTGQLRLACTLHEEGKRVVLGIKLLSVDGIDTEESSNE